MVGRGSQPFQGWQRTIVRVVTGYTRRRGMPPRRDDVRDTFDLRELPPPAFERELAQLRRAGLVHQEALPGRGLVLVADERPGVLASRRRVPVFTDPAPSDEGVELEFPPLTFDEGL